MAESQSQQNIREEARRIAATTTDLNDIISELNEVVKKKFFGANAERGQKLVRDIRNEYAGLFKDVDKNVNKLTQPYEKFTKYASKFPLNKFFYNDKIESSIEEHKKKITEIQRQQALGNISETNAQQNIREQAKEIAKTTTDLNDIISELNEVVKKKFFGANAERGQKLVRDIGNEYKKLFSDVDKNVNKLTQPYEKFNKYASKFPLNKFFYNDKIESSIEQYKKKVTEIQRKQALGNISEKKAQDAQLKMRKELNSNIFKSLNITNTALTGLAGLGVLLAKKLFDQIKAVDEATSQLVKTTGILDASFSKTLIQATESSSILGGNIQLVGEYAAELVSNLSPAISLTSELVGNVAQVGERFQIGADNAVKLTQIISELTNTAFEEASGQVEGLVESLGRLGPAVAKDLAQSYDSVIDRFGIGLESLKQQTLQAVQLGLSISKVADISEKLLDFQSSISSEFKASAILGQQVNLQKARQLAFEGNIVGALNETLDRVEQIGDFEKLNFFQRRAIAEATGLSVSELQKELNLRRQIGVQGRIDEATRATALGKFEEIQRRIQAVLFKVLSSPNIQQAFDNFANAVIAFLQSPRFNQIINSLGRAVDFLGNLLGGGKELKFNILQGTVGLQNTDATNIAQQRRATLQGTQSVDDAVITPQRRATPQDVDDAVITPQGDVIRTNPRDFIIATQTPQTLIQPTENSQMMGEMVSLLRELKQNGVQSVVNLDGKRVSTALTNRIRY